MGGVLSCIKSVFATIGNVLRSIVHGIAGILQSIIGGIVSLFDILISFLTCGYCGSKRHKSTHASGATTTTGKRRGFGRRSRV